MTEEESVYQIFRIFYLGDRYYGSQWQPGKKTVQGQLIESLEILTGEPFDIQSVQLSGRTDRGVHSIGQLVLIKTALPIMINQINKLLPDDIVLWADGIILSDFVPRYDVLLRTYRYFTRVEPQEIRLSLIKHALQDLLGTNNLKVLSKPDGDRPTTATILNASVDILNNNVLTLEISGVSFLWKLVRKLMTLILLIGKGELPDTVIGRMINDDLTLKSGIMPSPPEGLVMVDAAVPIRLSKNKGAIRKIRRVLTDRLEYLTNSLTMTSALDKLLSI